MSTVTQQSSPSVKRQNNRPKEVIAAEKAAKAERKLARDDQNEVKLQFKAEKDAKKLRRDILKLGRTAAKEAAKQAILRVKNKIQSGVAARKEARILAKAEKEAKPKRHIRPKEEIEADKAAKAERKLAREQAKAEKGSPIESDKPKRQVRPKAIIAAEKAEKAERKLARAARKAERMLDPRDKSDPRRSLRLKRLPKLSVS
jgi:hypothetical protein